MPYQEEPRDVPLQFSIDVAPDRAGEQFVPIVVTASIEGARSARAAAERVAADMAGQYRRTQEHYARLMTTSARVTTPDARLNRGVRLGARRDGQRAGDEPARSAPASSPAFAHRATASGPGSPGSLAATRCGRRWRSPRPAPFDTARTALAFLAKYQRDDGKIPHEISQSAVARALVHRISVCMGQRRRDTPLRDRPRRSLAHNRRSRTTSSSTGRRS